jgi:hypothetical protein
MVTTDVPEGTIDEALWYHYDLTNDVLHLRLATERKSQTISEETSDGFLLLRRADNNKPAGLTVVDWWKRFGRGSRPDSIAHLDQRIQPWASRLPVA